MIDRAARPVSRWRILLLKTTSIKFHTSAGNFYKNWKG